jgi:hypothetical protein
MPSLGMRLLISTVVLLSASFATAAVSQERLSATDEREVRNLVTSFNYEILRTRDLTSYLNTPSADVMAKAWFVDDDLLSHELLVKTKPDELRRLFIAMTNLSYLSTLYIYSRVYMKTGGFEEHPPRQQYPRAVFLFLRQNPTISAWWSPNGFSKPMTSAQQLHALTSTFETGTTMLRRYLRSHPPEQTRMYRKNLGWLEPLLKSPEIETCETTEQCAPYPVHTQFVNVQLPVVELLLVRRNGKFEITAVGLLEGLW